MQNASTSVRSFQPLGIMLGLIVASTILGISLYKARTTPPFVDVKGLTTQEVEAD